MILPRLLLATNNRGKIDEYRRLLEGVPFALVSPAEIGFNATVNETGDTFEENAILKATTLCAAAGIPALADDSGLEVDALGGEPGVRSARYAGKNKSDEDRVAFLLKKLKTVPMGRRQARFRCVIAIAQPGGRVDLANGECSGEIALEPKGDKGFGYDPIFFVPELNRTMAELSPDMKNRISHRARAAEKAKALLEEMGGVSHTEEL